MNDSTVVGLFLGVWLFVLAFLIVTIVATWKIYTKAGKPGWTCLIPFYNNYMLVDIALGKGILFLLLFVPIVNFIFSFFVLFKLATVFGKSPIFGIGLIFMAPIFLCILAFGDAEYIGVEN